MRVLRVTLVLRPGASRGWIARLDHRDRRLFGRWALDAGASRRSRLAWSAVTHLGGATSTLTAGVAPLGSESRLREAAGLALLVLIASHLVVQVVKRSVGRPRPSRGEAGSLIAVPDRFSFPSGHAAAAMSIAFGYAIVFPHLAAPLVGGAVLVGMSRVVLGVHYPGDVLAGQLIALATGLAVVH